jgi:dienelactone hydrolase
MFWVHFKSLLALTIFCFMPIVAFTQTPWPDYISSTEPDVSESPIAAVLPNDVVVLKPDSALAPNKARWSGQWFGWACSGRLCDIKMVVEKISVEAATIVYIGAAASGTVSERIQAKFSANELQGTLSSGTQLSFRFRTEGIVEFVAHAKGVIRVGGVLSQGLPEKRLVERIPTAFVEDGVPVSLELVIYKPTGPGPFPMLMFNHGSTGNGNRPAEFKTTWTNPALAKFFNDKGWLVAFPQRRGRGKSDGTYDEGFEVNRAAGYSCNPNLSLPGLERALIDMDVATDYLSARPDVDNKRMLIGGVSRGGIASVVYAGTRPTRFQGVVNFVGGWVGDDCNTVELINTVSFKRGAAYLKPMLWLYGENDPFYKMEHSRKNFDSFISAGGKGVFKVFSPATGQSGHGLVAMPNLWLKDLTSYLDQLDLK